MMFPLKWAVITCALLSLVASCKTTTPKPTTEQSGEQQTAPAVEPDYIAIGFPATERQWSREDYRAALLAIRTLVQRDKQGSLPSSHGAGADIFQRMTNPDNLLLVGNTSLPVNTRLAAGLEYQQATKEIFLEYMNAYAATSPGAHQSDILALLGYMLKVSAAFVHPVSEFLQTLSPDGPQYAERMLGLVQMKDGLGQQVAGALQVLSEQKVYSEEQRIVFIDDVKVALPPILDFLDPTIRQESLLKLDALRKQSDGDFQSSVSALAATISESY